VQPHIALESSNTHGTITYIGRAPVFDRRLGVSGYQLLIDEFTRDGTRSSNELSRQLLTRALLEVGLDSLIGGKLGFIEIPVPLLAEGVHLALPPHRMMIEVSGAIDVDALEVIREVRTAGYRVLIGSLEACTHPSEAVRLAAGVRIDTSGGDPDPTATQILEWSPRAQLLADRLTSSEDVDALRKIGFSWFRGDVLHPAEQVDEPTIAPHRVAVLQLLAELERPDVDFDDIDALVSIDLGMSYKLLRMANSSYLALERRVERSRDAIVYLGIDTVRAVAALLSLSEASDHPLEIVQLSLIRARHCEELVRAKRPELAHAAFTTGLFSALDTLLGLSVEQILLRIPVADHIAAALRDRAGDLGRALEIVLAYEHGDLERLNRLGADPSSTVLAYRHALSWMNDIERGLGGAGRTRPIE
jgi:c-di-GMP phosphodiesterase